MLLEELLFEAGEWEDCGSEVDPQQHTRMGGRINSRDRCGSKGGWRIDNSDVCPARPHERDFAPMLLCKPASCFIS